MKWTHGLVAGLFTLSIFAGGCAQLIGIEERPVEASGGRASGGSPDDGSTGGEGGAPLSPDGVPLDVEYVRPDKTIIPTTQLCVDYCKSVTSNCIGEFQQYKTLDLCVQTCSKLPQGDVEGSGNTATCRLAQAENAKNNPAEHCPYAGPGGGGVCAANCEAYCQLLQAICPAKYEFLDDCRASCEGIEDNGNLGGVVTDATNLQCRLYHLGAAAGTPTEAMTHCNHGEYNPKNYPQDHCLEDPDTLVPCDKHCRILMANCGDSTSDSETNTVVYESQKECEAACSAFEEGPVEGGPAGGRVNTRGCHFYHARLAGEDRKPHCAHAGPSGEGVCAKDVESAGALTFSGNCDSYCRLYKKGCQADFDATLGDAETCMTECIGTFLDRGARGTDASLVDGTEPFYSVLRAPESDTLHCRIYRAVKAVTAVADKQDADAAAACTKAALDGDCADP